MLFGCGVVQVGTEDRRTGRDDLAVGPRPTQPASDRCGGQPDLFGDPAVSQPASGGCEGHPDGLDAVGAPGERPDREEHMAAVALPASPASWGHPVGAPTEEPHRPLPATPILPHNDPHGLSSPEHSESGQA